MTYEFANFYGNKELISSLERALKHGKTSHAYIITGASGLGKSRLALTFAKALLCENSSESGLICGSCSPCKVTESGNHPDIIFVQSDKQIGVDLIREITKDINVLPYGSRKIIIIDRADTMTVQAQNALLKTLEEPPKYAVILALADNINFLPTVLSRCVALNLRPLTPSQMKAYGADDLYTGHAMGNIGYLKKLLEDEIFTGLKDFVPDFLIKINTRTLDDIFESYKILEEHRDYIEEILDFMTVFLRDCTIAKENLSSFVFQKSKLNEINLYIKNTTTKALLKRLDIIDFTKTALGQNANFQLTMELMLLKLRSV